jgi:energy-coupling factor transporter ATP-binding protein EcfA2
MTEIVDSLKFDVAIPHRNWQRALSDSFAVLNCASPGEVVCITGPSRAGKSLLISRLSGMLSGNNNFEETGLLPAVVVEAVNSGTHGGFATKAFTQRMLQAVKHPLFTMMGQGLDDLLAMQKMDRSTEATLRMALEQAFIARSTRYLFIDEAQHVKYASKNALAAFAVMDSWKCLAQSTGLVIVFVGAYPILDVIKNSPHLLGRNHQVHFPRYYANKDDILAFGQLLNFYSELVCLDDQINSLNDLAELMYGGSLGCIGLLKAWLKRTDAIATMRSIPITEELLTQTRLTDSDLLAIRKEIQAGEKLLERQPISKPYVARTVKPNHEVKVTPKKRKKPFQRNPVRHKSGNRTEKE